MSDRIKNILRGNIDVAGVFVLMLFVFSYIMFVVKWDSDLWAHANIAKKMLEEHRVFMGNFLMYFLVNAFTLFSGCEIVMGVVLTMLISIANTAKYVLVREAFKEWTTGKVAKWSATALLVVYVVPLMYFLKPLGIFLSANNMYLGYYVPNVWHNSTILCMMPLAIACYLLSVKQIKEYSDKRNWYIALFLALSILIKPSFFFVYVIAYPIIMFHKYGLGKEICRSSIPLLIGCICLAFEYMTIYYRGGNDGSGVMVDIMSLFTLNFWKQHALYFIVSILFPMLFLLLYGRRVVSDLEFWFVVIMVVCACGIGWCCHEIGPRVQDGNFGWQIIAAMWFVYYYMLKTMVTDNRRVSFLRRGGKSQKVMFATYSIHVIMGGVYLAKFLITHDFG